MFKKFTTNEFDDLKQQHNIAIFVGNGFDISILNKYKSNKFPQRTTSYKDFFDYITFLGLPDQDNLIYKEMVKDRIKNEANWSDFEKIIDGLLQNGNIDTEKLAENVKSFQEYFSRYLNELIDTSLLVRIDEDASKNPYFRQTFGNFAKDIPDSYTSCSFIKGINTHDLFNYVIFNFNYTPLLDNFINPYQTQFNPHPHISVDSNFYFFYPKEIPSRNDWYCSSYFNYELIHPHGNQFIPKSILFGTDLDEKEYDKSSGLERTFIKSFWAQNNIKYKSYLEESELFIIYGMSLSKTDAWWFDNIFDALLPKANNESGKNCDAELIIYYKVQNTNDVSQIDKVKNSFIDSCIRHKHSSDADKEAVCNKIHVVLFENNDTYFLGLEKK